MSLFSEDRRLDIIGNRFESISDSSGRITEIKDEEGQWTFSGRHLQTVILSLGYQYNDDFAIESLTYAGSTVSYAYDNDGLLTGAGNFSITRKPENGFPYNITGGSLNLTRTFNGHGETDSQDYVVNSQKAFSWSVTRDDSGKIRTKTETLEGTIKTYHYDYDLMGRLLSVKDENSILVEEYRYDPNGSRNYDMNTHRGIIGRNLTYSDEDYLLTAGNISYNYDMDGFLEKKSDASGDTLYNNYSSRGELLSVSLPDGRIIEYVHDPLGRRIAKKKDGAVVEKYLWQGRVRLLAVYDGNDALVMRFEYADGRMPVAMTTNDSSVYYLTCDQAGSLRTVTDVSGTVVRRIRYDSFGNIISPPGSSPLPEIPFGFAGGLHDRDTGLVRFGYRDYDPDVGRWTAKDPILFTGGDTDLYGYCLNDPVNFADPEGKYVFLIAAALGTVAVYTLEMAITDLTIAAALGYTAQQAIAAAESKSRQHGGKIDQNRFREAKSKYKNISKKCKKPPNDKDPRKDPPPVITPTIKQVAKREPWVMRILRAFLRDQHRQ